MMGPAFRQRRPAPAPTIRSVRVPAPMGGINTVDSGAAMPASDAVYLYNMIPAEQGLRSRLGYREWCTGLTGAADNKVRSVLPFSGSTATKNRLFAATASGLWNVSDSSAAPAQVAAFPDSSLDAGRGVEHVVITAAGHFLLYADEQNGLHVYDEATETWTRAVQGGGGTEFSGVDPSRVAFVTVWKNRVLLVEKGSTKVWYSAAGSLYGAYTALDLRAQFANGGFLVGVWHWTYDGGAGVDDSLVFVSSAGDVAIYQGSDPSSSSAFGLRGVWFVGGVVSGRRIAIDSGGDLLLLTSLGVLPLSKLVVGANTADARQFITVKIATLFNGLASLRRGLEGWGLHVHPTDNALLVTFPTYADQPTEQLAMSLTRGSWSYYRDLPILSAATWNGDFFFGTTDGRVCINADYVDDVPLANPNSFNPVQWSVLPAFQNLDSVRQKRIQLVRPILRSEAGAPTYETRAQYDFDDSEIAEVTLPSANPGTGGSLWGSAVWDADSALWAGTRTSRTASGATGLGVDVSVALRGAAISKTVLVGLDVYFTEGGLL
jgi:hypothetical protein